MAEFLDFAARQWVLFALLFVILGLLVGSEVRQRMSGVRTIGPLDALRLINDRDAIVVDVREISEFRKGHIRGALNVPWSKFDQRLSEFKSHKNKPLLICCQSGARSSGAANKLVREGFEVSTLRGGLPAWENENLPLGRGHA